MGLKFFFVLFFSLNGISFSNSQGDVRVDLYFEPFDASGWQSYLNFDILKRKFKNIRIAVYPIVRKDSNGRWYSSHGEIETTEVARIETLIERYPSKLNDYLIARSLNMSLTGWKDSLIYAGINPVDFEDYLRVNKESLLRNAYKRVEEKKIEGPMIFINSNPYTQANNLTGLIEVLNKYTDKKINLYKSEMSKLKGVEFKIVYNKETLEWVDDNLTKSFERIFTPLKISRLDISELESNEKNKIKMLPAYLIEKTPEVEEVFNNAIERNLIDDIGKYYVYYNQNSKLLLLNRKQEDKKLELFIMSHCPFGVMAVNTLINAVENNRISKDIKIDIHYIGDVYKDGNGNLNFHSRHGDDEWKEDARQVFIKKNFPDKYFTYLKERNKNYTSNDWEDAAKKAGIDPQIIREKSKEAEKILEEDFNYTNSLGINTSPTFIVNSNILVVGLSQLKSMDGYKDIEIANQSGQGGCGK